MIAHGFVVVGLFLLQTLFTEDETRTIDEMGGIRTQAPKFASCFNTNCGCITNYF
jgi:NADH-quinone oxidoreductase subunit M